MMRRAIKIGFSAGFLLSLAGLYPLLGLFAPYVLPGWQPPVPNPLLHGLLLMVSAAIGLPTLIIGGAWAARYAGAKGWREGAMVGMLAGGLAGTGNFITLVSPLNALSAYSVILPNMADLLAATPLPPGTLLRYSAAFNRLAFSAEVTMGALALFWGVQGALMGWRQRWRETPKPTTLFDLSVQRQPLTDWFAEDETAVRVGLKVGIIVGVLGLITTFGWFYVGFAEQLPAFGEMMENSRRGMVAGQLSDAVSLLSPILSLALLSFGVVVVALIKNPPNRYRARMGGVILAAIIIASMLFAVGLRILYFNVGLIPFTLSQQLKSDPTQTLATLRTLRQFVQTLAVPSALIAATLLVSWTALGLTLVVGYVVGALQGAFATFLVPYFLPRPVDRAAAYFKQLTQQPEKIIPILHDVCITKGNAHDVLLHLAIKTEATLPEISHLTAAFYTLAVSSNPKDHQVTMKAIKTTLGAHPEWEWATAVGSIYATLQPVLVAQTLEQLLQIPPPNIAQTGTLPAHIVEAGAHIDRTVMELKKVQRVEDLPTRLTFLENGLAAIHTGQRFVSSTLRTGEGGTAVILPLHTALTITLDHWQDLLITAIKRLKGRADLTATLQSQLCSHCTPLPLVWLLKNQGLNVAQDVRLHLLPGEGYQVGASQTEIDILPPGEERQVTLDVVPDPGVVRLRVAWEIIYDDAIVDDRHLEFGDVVEFVRTERPFTRVFPIPYVTGTPLKTDDVFVGRTDVFDFIQENLLGAHQNNVIILHGQRRTGKTSVLYRLGQIMSDSHVGVLIDMQGKPARGAADFLYSIADDILFALEDEGVEMDLPPRSEFEAAPEFFFRSRFLRNLYTHLNGKNLLLLFDEFEELQQRVENGRLQPEIFQFLRNLMQHETKIDFVFSGTHRLEDLSAAYWSILFNIAAYHPITFLSPTEVQRLITEPIAAYAIEYDPLATERIIQVAAGHPYFTQLILHEMMVYHNETERSYLTVADVGQVLERIVARGEAHFKYIWAESTPGEREILQAAAELLHDKESVTVNELQDFLRSRGRKSEDDWRGALRLVNGRDILTRRDAKSAHYRFKVDLIRLWIDRTRPAL